MRWGIIILNQRRNSLIFALLMLLISIQAEALENFICPEGFVCPEEVLAKTEFWTKLFAVYDENQAIFYDAINPQVTYKVIDGQKCRIRQGGKTISLPLVQQEKNRIR